MFKRKDDFSNGNGDRRQENEQEKDGGDMEHAGNGLRYNGLVAASVQAVITLNCGFFFETLAPSHRRGLGSFSWAWNFWFTELRV